MKRGNDDEKIMGPMFPRLHVNDTEKGGPRAPPRNKMALYEQLTVPSQRYTVGSVPLNPNNNTNLVSSTSASQGMGRERNMCYPFYQPSLAPSYDELQVRQPETGCLTNEPPPVENIEKPLEEDDFMVPLFSQPGLEQSKGKTQNSKDGERHTHLSSNNPNSRGGDFISRQLVINRDGRNCRVDASMKSSDIIMREKDGGSLSEDTHRQQGRQEKQRLSSLEKTDSRLDQNHNGNVLGAEHRYGEGASELPLESAQKDISSRQKDAPRVGYGNKDAHKADNGMARVRDDNLLERENMDRGNDVSETSMVDCASGMDLSPDDVVGVIGRKHFWKARTAIANQQRVFAIQVFELHRLIKVQRLIAESPHLLLEGSAFVGKTSLKTSPVKKYSDYGVKAQAHVLKHKDNSQKPADKLEGTAENAVAKVPIPSQNATQPAGYPSFSVSPVPAPPVNADPKMGPWGFQQPAVHQWLVPVMSPSEGLVYKPYPAPGMMSPSPGMMSPMYGCCGPPGPSPMMGNMMNMPYVLPNPHFHQGMGMPPGVHFGGQGCFPTYAMPTMSTALSGSAVDQNQMNQFCGPNPYGAPTGQPAAGSANSSLQHQNSCNMSSQKNKLTTPTPKAVPPKERELQGSTASSPSERPGTRTAAAAPAEGTDTLCLFPTVPAIEVSEEAPPIENTPRVIKVVPHNAKSTKESAARIFQSIQAERRQYESS